MTALVPPSGDLKSVKARQQAAWAAGDYAVVGTTLVLVGELLCEANRIVTGQVLFTGVYGLLGRRCQRGGSWLLALGWGRDVMGTGGLALPELRAKSQEPTAAPKRRALRQ